MCDLSADDFEPTTSSTSRRCARKPHFCDACGGPIAVGETYARVFLLCDGLAAAEKQCAACEAVADSFGADHNVWVAPSGLREFLDECARDGGESSERWAVYVTEMDARRQAATEGT